MTVHEPEGRLEAAARRIGGVVVRLYPRAFEARSGADMVDAWVTLIRVSRRHGPLARAGAFAGGLWDLLRGVVREWGRVRPTGMDRDDGRGGMFEGLKRDVRLAVRGLRRQPLFTLIAAGSLAIGIGASTAVFSVANTLLLQPLPEIPAYDRVVELGRATDGRGFDTFSYPDFVEIAEEVPALADASMYTLELFSVTRGDGEEGIRANGLLTSASYFDVLGAVPSMGRFFGPSEAVGGAEEPAVVISHRFWTRQLGGDPDILGSTILVNRVPFQVVGITAERFVGHLVGLSPDVFVPVSRIESLRPGRRAQFEQRGSSWMLVLGRLAEGATLETLRVQLDAVGTRLAEEYPRTNARRSFTAMPLGPIPGAGRQGVQLFMTALLAMVGLIVLVTSTNVAGMFLARATARHREFAVRLSIGAGRRAIVQQLTVETLLVFLLGGGLGLLGGGWLVGLVRPDLIPAPVPLDFDFQPDLTVAVVGLATTLLTGLVFGLLPAVRASRLELTAAMREDGRGGVRGVGRMRLLLAGSQVGLSLVLLATAALFVRSLQRAAELDAGFDPEGTWVTYVDLGLEGYDDASGPVFQEEMLAALTGEPWVEQAALAADLPLDLSRSSTAVLPEGWTPGPEAPLLGVDFNRVSPGYFDALGIPVLAGRRFASSDRPGTARVAIVSERFADEAWPGEEPLGRTFGLGRTVVDSLLFEVVGIVGDVKNQMVTEAGAPHVYFPLAQRYSSSVQVAVRTELGERDAVSALRGALVAADPTMSRGPIVSLEEFTSLGLLPQRIAAWLTSGLGLVALLLAALGIYGVVSFAVTAQRREIGIRMALGADARRVVGRLVRGGLLLAGPGLVIGVLLSLGVGRLVQALLLDLSPADPVALGGVAVVLVVVVTLASWIPARRAAWVDPAESLRQE